MSHQHAGTWANALAKGSSIFVEPARAGGTYPAAPDVVHVGGFLPVQLVHLLQLSSEYTSASSSLAKLRTVFMALMVSSAVLLALAEHSGPLWRASMGGERGQGGDLQPE